MSIRKVARMHEFHIRFVRIPRWQLMLGAGLVFALIAAFFVLALGVFLLLLPALVIVGAIAYLFSGARAPIDRGGTNDHIIDGEYRIVEQDRLEDRRERAP
jgi:hypothetical protein